MSRFEAKVTSKGQITLPARMREALGISTGDKLVFSEAAEGGFRVSAQNRGLSDLKGLVRRGPGFTSADVKQWLEEGREERAGYMPRAKPRP